MSKTLYLMLESDGNQIKVAVISHLILSDRFSSQTKCLSKAGYIMDRSDTSGFVSGGAATSCPKRNSIEIYFNQKMFSTLIGDLAKNGNVGDTTLRLDGFGYGTRETPSFWNSQTTSDGRDTFTNGPDDGCKLVLGLGPTPSAYSKVSSQRDSILKLGPSGGTDAVSNVLDFSTSTHDRFDAPHQPGQVSSYGNRNVIPVVDEAT